MLLLLLSLNVLASLQSVRRVTSSPCRCNRLTGVAANTRLDSLNDLIRHKANLQVQCRTCAHTSIIDAARFARLCFLKTWNTQLGSWAAGLPPALQPLPCQEQQPQGRAHPSGT